MEYIRRVWFIATAAAAAGLALGLGASPNMQAQLPSGYAVTLAGIDGGQRVLAQVPSTMRAPRVSPDGTRVAFEMRGGPGAGDSTIWVASLSDVPARRALPGANGAVHAGPLWTMDGNQLVFLDSGGRAESLFSRRADGSDDAVRLVDGHGAEGWNREGTLLRVLTRAPGGDYGIAGFDLSTRVLSPLVDIPRSAQHGSALSPDGRWLAYASNETGRDEVWLTPYPPTSVRYRMTRAGGSRPLWSNDGASLFFDRDRQLFQVLVNLDGPAPVGEPRALPIKGFLQSELRRQYDLMPDGRQFLVLMPSPQK